MKELASLFLLAAWVSGFVIAKGFWSTLFCIMPFWAWYIVTEKILVHFGLV